ncbi:MAG: M15 family metallopeptidase, partial [Eubacteriales bacterium]|nr:M15 family metallopeptidase [Eubacteriales bacterium]
SSDLENGRYAQYFSAIGNEFYISSALYDSDDVNTLYRESYVGIGKKLKDCSIFSTVEAAKWIYDNCPSGTEVEIADPYPFGRAPGEIPSLNTDYYFTDPTDPMRPETNTGPEFPYKVYIEKGSFTISLFGLGENGEYSRPVASYRTATGRTVGRTPVGIFQILKKERWHTFEYPFLGGYAQYGCFFTETIMIHSPVYGLKDIKYVIPDSYNAIGEMETAGCLRTTTDAAYWIFTYCPIGTEIEIVNGSPLGTTSPEPPVLDSGSLGMDPTDPFRPESLWDDITSSAAYPSDSPYAAADFPFVGRVSLQDGSKDIYLRAGPDAASLAKGRLADGTEITAVGFVEGWLKINFLNGTAYIPDSAIIFSDSNTQPFSEKLYADILPKIKEPAFLPEADKDLLNDLIDLRAFDDSIKINLVFASKDNFTGTKLYPFEVCLLQRDTAEKLLLAQSLFEKDGYSIKIYDAYRPYSVQLRLFEFVTDPAYIADPKSASFHNRGCAVDMTLTDSSGNELEMPTPMHTLGPEANIYYSGMTDEARTNMEYMQKIMLQCGFLNYELEWWHFKDANSSQYMVTDYDFTEIVFSNSASE